MTAIAIFGLATITFGQTVPSYVPTSGLVGWWPFNGNANDESVNGNNGVVNGPILTTDRFSNSNKAYSFDGVNDNINPLQNNLPFGTTARTISIWFQRIGTGGNLFSYGSANTSNAYMIAIGANIISNQGWADDFPVYPSIDNSWHNVVCTFDGLNSTIYLDNSNLGSNSMTSWNTIAGSFYFGTRVLNDMAFFNGNIDDIAIWNRVLSTQEIADLYNGCQLTINSQPSNQNVNINNNAQFVVSSSDPSATYQWQTDLGVGFQNLNNVGQYSGTANDTITIANTTLSNNNQPFRCIISSGACTDTSNVAVLTVLCNISVTTQPINQSVNISNNAQFTTASSDPLAAYQWQTDLGVGFQNLNNVGQYSGTTNDTLTIANTTLSNNSQPFRCIISSGSCSDTSAVAVLTVNNNVGINEASQDNLFSVYPNPAQSVINVKADIKLIGKVYSVYDNTGKVVLTGKLNSENTTIELSNLSIGIYMFRVGENMKQTFKVIKE